MFNLTSKSLPRALVLTLALGITTAATLSPAHADGRSIAQACIERDDCHITILDNGDFIITIDGGGIIYCPGLDGECVSLGNVAKGGNPVPVTNPITTTPVPNAGPTGGTPVTSIPTPPKAPPVTAPSGYQPIRSPITGPIRHPVGYQPIRSPITGPIRHPVAGGPVLLARGVHR